MTVNLKTDRTFGVPEPGRRYRDRVGAYLVTEHAGHIALIQTPKGYFLPGGGMEPGESAETCIRREILEELGYTVRIDEVLGIADMYVRHETIGWFHPVQYYLRGELIHKVSVPIEEDHKMVWRPAIEAENLLFPECQRWAVACYIKRK